MFGGFALASRVQNHGPERACPATCVLPCLALPSSVAGSVNGQQMPSACVALSFQERARVHALSVHPSPCT